MLVPLLLVHGHRSYKRMSKLIMYSFSKNLAHVLPSFWFSFFSQFSGQLIYFDLFFTMYNALFTAFPILAIAMWDQSVSATTLAYHPLGQTLYADGRENKSFDNKTFLSWVALGIYQSVVPFVFAYHVMQGVTENGQVCFFALD